MDRLRPGGPATPPLKRSKRTINAVTGEDESPSGSYDPDESPQNTAQVRFEGGCRRFAAQPRQVLPAAGVTGRPCLQHASEAPCLEFSDEACD